MPSAPHLRMTVQMLRAAGAASTTAPPTSGRSSRAGCAGRGWDIEPDLSGAAPFFAAALVTGGAVTLPGWPRSSTQPVDQLRELLTAMGGEVTLGTGRADRARHRRGARPRRRPVRGERADPGAGRAGRARRLAVPAARRRRTSAATRPTGSPRWPASWPRSAPRSPSTPDGLEIRPRPLRGAVFETYDDHRMAHAARSSACAVPGVQLTDVACTSKTLPEFPALWSAMVTAARTGERS